MKIIGYILIFAGVVNIIKSLSTETSNSNPIERFSFGILFIIIGVLFLKVFKPKSWYFSFYLF